MGRNCWFERTLPVSPLILFFYHYINKASRLVGEELTTTVQVDLVAKETLAVASGPFPLQNIIELLRKTYDRLLPDRPLPVRSAGIADRWVRRRRSPATGWIAAAHQG
ncbi:MAG: hypothetical protein GDA41_00190 [Rhodospirillales bacterium]|nr:hypothetical protein [Rhodospirillales bacterium]